MTAANDEQGTVTNLADTYGGKQVGLDNATGMPPMAQLYKVHLAAAINMMQQLIHEVIDGEDVAAIEAVRSAHVAVDNLVTASMWGTRAVHQRIAGQAVAEDMPQQAAGDVERRAYLQLVGDSDAK